MTRREPTRREPTRQVVRFHGKKLSWCSAYLENLDARAASLVNTGRWEFPEQVRARHGARSRRKVSRYRLCSPRH